MVNSRKKKNVSALLITDDNPEDLEQLLKFKGYLIDEAGFTERDCWLVSGQNTLDYEIKDVISEFFERAQKRGKEHTAVLVYNGHGTETGISPTEAMISYYDIGEAVGHSQFVFINNCCLAGAAIPVFRELRLLPRQGSVLAATAAHLEIDSEIFLESLVHSFRQRKPYNRRILYCPDYLFRWENRKSEGDVADSAEDVTLSRGVLYPQRCGKSLDHLFYPLRNHNL